MAHAVSAALSFIPAAIFFFADSARLRIVDMHTNYQNVVGKLEAVRILWRKDA